MFQSAAQQSIENASTKSRLDGMKGGRIRLQLVKARFRNVKRRYKSLGESLDWQYNAHALLETIKEGGRGLLSRVTLANE